MSLWIWNNTFLGAWLIKEKYKQKKISLGKPLRAGWEIFSCPAKSLRFFFFTHPLHFGEITILWRLPWKWKLNKPAGHPPSLSFPSAPTGQQEHSKPEALGWQGSLLSHCPWSCSSSGTAFTGQEKTPLCKAMPKRQMRASAMPWTAPQRAQVLPPHCISGNSIQIHPFLNKSSQNWHVPNQQFCQRSASQGQPQSKFTCV